MKNILNSYPGILFLAILAFIFVAAFGPEIMNYPPRSVHIFRQSDCLAYTRTYYQNNTGFFDPACYNLIGKDGRVVSEFPIMYYISAKLCRLFGFHYSIIRMVTFLTYVLGLYYLFLCCRMWIKNQLLAYFPVIIMATSPYFFFYALNFLPNVPAICLSFVGFYYLLRFEKDSKIYQGVLSALFFAVAALIKPTDGLLLFGGYAGAFLFSKHMKQVRKIHAKSFVTITFVLLLVSYAWFAFVKQYNNKYGNIINLQGIYPLWDTPQNDVVLTFNDRLFGLWLACFQHISLMVLLVIFAIIYIVKWKALNPFLRSLTLFIILGSFGYSILWFKAFYVHDYYLLIFTIPAVFMGITISAYFSESIWPKLNKKLQYVVAALLVALMVNAVYYNQSVLMNRYADENIGFIEPDVFEVEPFLRKLGIKPSDIILSVGDGAPNISLAAIGNPGYTSDLFGRDKYTARYAKANGAKYMVVLSDAYLTDTAYAPYTTKFMGKYKHISVYDLR